MYWLTVRKSQNKFVVILILAKKESYSETKIELIIMIYKGYLSSHFDYLGHSSVNVHHVPIWGW